MIDEPYENNYANGMGKMNDSMVEQLTVPEDSQDFHVKQKKFKMVNSGLVKTATTNHGMMSDQKDRPMWAIQEDDYDLDFVSTKQKESQQQRDNLLKLMSQDDFENIKNDIEWGLKGDYTGDQPRVVQKQNLFF